MTTTKRLAPVMAAAVRDPLIADTAVRPAKTRITIKRIITPRGVLITLMIEPVLLPNERTSNAQIRER